MDKGIGDMEARLNPVEAKLITINTVMDRLTSTVNSTSNMRGLNTFISDVRACRSREQELKRINKELANIRSNFKDGKMDGYQKKKYVCKLMYIYLLGHDVDFGHMEAVNLMSSYKYSEKQIGYLAITLWITESSDLVRLVINSVRKDLEDPNEIFNCLALQAIADLGGKEIAESLAGDVYKLLVSPKSINYVKKKAALCLLKLYRRHADVVPIAEWAEKLMELVDDYDLGVNCSSYSLLMALASAQPEPFVASVGKTVTKLHKLVIEREFIPDNLYYSVPVPWLQVKMLRYLMLFPPPRDLIVVDKLHSCLQFILSLGMESYRNPQQSNATNMVVIEAINVVMSMSLETGDSAMVDTATAILVRYISAKETNLRYLGLEIMARSTNVPACLALVRKHIDDICLLLHDRDVSVRRRAIDVLFNISNASNAKRIVEEMMAMLPNADFTIREELVLKIAILTEKHTREPRWYVDVIFELIATAGEHVSAEVWHRVVQVITNNPDLHQYATKQIFELVKSPTCPENAVKIGGYLLGEFGDLIVNEPGCGPMQQVTHMKNKYKLSTPSTRALLLSTFAKMANLFPEVKAEVAAVLKYQEAVLDAEIQQRACEYLELVNMPTDDLLQAVFEQMPAYPERESALVVLLRKQAESATSGGAEESAKPVREANSPSSPTPGSSTFSSNLPSAVSAPSPKPPMMDLLDLDVVATPAATMSTMSSTPASPAVPVEKMDAWLRNLLVQANGVLYEDATLQIGVKTEYRGAQGRIALYFGNKTSNLLTPFNVNVRPVEGVTTLASVPLTEIGPLAQAVYGLTVECSAPFSTHPVVEVTFGRGGALPPLRLPIALHKFAEPFPLPAADFMTKWKQIGGAPRESQETFRPASGGATADVAIVRALLTGVHWNVLDGVDPNPSNVVAASVWQLVGGAKFGALLRLEVAAASGMYRLTVRSTNEVAAAAIRGQLSELVGKM